MLKGTQGLNVPLAWEGPRCPNHLEIPGPNSWSWAVSLAAGTQRKQSDPAQAQPVSPSWGRQAAQLGRFRVEKCKRQPGGAGEKSTCTTRSEVTPAHQSPPQPPSHCGFVSDHSPLGRTNIMGTAAMFFSHTPMTFLGRAIAQQRHRAGQTTPKHHQQSFNISSPSLAGICTHWGGSQLTYPSSPWEESLAPIPLPHQREGWTCTPKAFWGTQVPKGISSYLTPCLQERRA